MPAEAGFARVAELADALDLGSSGFIPCEFESRLSHHIAGRSVAEPSHPAPTNGRLGLDSERIAAFWEWYSGRFSGNLPGPPPLLPPGEEKNRER